MQITLHYQYQNRAAETYSRSGGEIIIGRPKNIPLDIDLSPDPRVSRPHGRIFYNLSAWWVEDLRSRNGTWLNGRRVNEATVLSDQDKLQMGDTIFTVQLATMETLFPAGDLESRTSVDEVEPLPSISEDERTEIVARFSDIASAYSTMQGMLDRFLEEIGVLFPQTERRTIVLIDPDKELLPRASWPASETGQVSFTLARQAITSRQALHWVRDLSSDSTRAASLFDTTAALCAPMIFNGQPIGVIYLDTTQPETTFGKPERDRLSEIAQVIAPPIKAFDHALPACPSIFISYAPAEGEFVERLAADLRRRRVKVWYDQRLQIGDNRQQQITTAIRGRDGFAVVLSPDSVTSKQVEQELNMAIQANKKIFPLLYKACDLPEAIQDLVALDMAASQYQENLEKLVEAINQLAEPPQEEAMRILFLAANPFDTDQLRLGEEMRTIEERLRLAEFRDRFELVSHWAVRHTDLSEYLLRHTPHIVHFSGHGTKAGKIVLENELGQAQTVTPEALGQLFRILKDNIRCVVLNACFSQSQAEAMVQEIDCVVGMSASIDDAAAVRFSGGFYRALGYGRDVQTAFELGCNEISLAKLADDAVPQLLVKPGVKAANIIFA